MILIKLNFQPSKINLNMYKNRFSVKISSKASIFLAGVTGILIVVGLCLEAFLNGQITDPRTV